MLEYPPYSHLVGSETCHLTSCEPHARAWEFVLAAMTEKICHFVEAPCFPAWDLVVAAHVAQLEEVMRILVHPGRAERLLERQHRRQLEYLFRPQ